MSNESELREAIENCNREEIHIPGTIQSYGALVAADAVLTKIEFASINTQEHLGFSAEDLIGAPIGTLLDGEQVHQARNALSHRTIEGTREIVGEQKFRDQRFQITIHRRDSRAILEFLPISGHGRGEGSALEKTRALLAESVGEDDFDVLLESSVERLRGQTEFDRVKAYRFLPDGSGEVVAESRAAQAESFLGLRFPASDIPPIARQLYAKTPIRVISKIDAEDIPILGQSPGERPLDLSLAVLRGTAGVHLQYLRNMGVGSSMTLPIVVEGRLWGLFALHNEQPLVPDPTMLMAAELSGKMLSLVIQHAEQLRHRRHLNECASIANRLFSREETKLSIETYWNENQQQLLETLPCDGIAYVEDDHVEACGTSPSKQACRAVRDLAASDDQAVTCYDDLGIRLPEIELGNTAGALVMKLDGPAPGCIILFRSPVLRTVKWAGAPHKDITHGERGLELNPRKSFEQYSESVTDKSEEWSNDDMEVATVLQKALVQAVSSQNERDESRHRLGLLVRELNHRVRNILTLVQSLSSNARSTATSLDGYAAALEQRIAALASAHDLLTRENMRGVQLDRLASTELKPYLRADREVAILTGPRVLLDVSVSPIFALVLHELTSNAVKYGALSTPTGTISLTWAVTTEGLEVSWVESGGPRVNEPSQEGFGRSIIESAIPFEFGGKANIAFDPDGLKASFLLPVGEFEIAVPAEKTESGAAVPRGDQERPDLTYERCLVVEDNFVIAQELDRGLMTLGFREVVAVSNIAHALKQLEKKTFDFCLLDVNLRGEMSTPVAKKLAELGIPFVFASGYGSEGREICDSFDAPFLTKPVQLSEIREALTKLGIKPR